MIENNFNETGKKPSQKLAICSTSKHTKSEDNGVKYKDTVFLAKLKKNCSYQILNI
jgi:hypothetical protein